MSLILPAGVRLAERDELPGPGTAKDEASSKVQGANLRPGYVARDVTNERFSVYVEANVDAPTIWPLFKGLCIALLKGNSVVLAGPVDDEPQHSNAAEVDMLIQALEPHAYQVANDGFVQIGMIEEAEAQISEVLIAPTKHFKIWANDRPATERTLKQFGLEPVARLEFLDEYPRTTVRLPQEKRSFDGALDLIEYINARILGKPHEKTSV